MIDSGMSFGIGHEICIPSYPLQTELTLFLGKVYDVTDFLDGKSSRFLQRIGTQ